MYITETSINKVREASITQVVGHYLKLNRNGQACCPFHNEKTPSFKVSESKDLFKCFGCGESGDAIAFVMKHEKVEFLKAIEIVAGITGITIEREEVANPEKYQKEKELKDRLKDVLSFTIGQYRQNLWALPEEHPVMQTLLKRGINRELISEWQLGWATEDWRHITSDIIERNQFDAAEKLGLVKRSGETLYDGYRSRITIPITNTHGEFIGMGGRFELIDPSDAGKNFPKYINSPENDLYSKSTVLYGLSRAQKAIKEKGNVYLVEGYFDVISMHTNGDANTVGTCGTALTTQQAQLLKRYTNNVIILRDGDNAGLNATIKDLNILVKAGFKVEVAILPKDEDPDSFVQQLPADQKGKGLKEHLKVTDGVHWFIQKMVIEADGDDWAMASVRNNVLEFLSKIPNDIIRSTYFDAIVKKYKWPKSDLQKRLNSLLDESTEEEAGDTNMDAMPDWMDRDEFLANGYCEVRTKKHFGYYSFGASGKVELTNFLVKPLFHIYGTDSRHLIQIDNGIKKAVLDVESKAMVSMDLLQAAVVTQGAYVIYGSKAQMLRVATNLLKQFPLCYEVKFLGWQSEGFFAFVDKIYVPGEGLKELNEWGIYTHNEKNYLVPAASAAYRELQRSGDDPYENDRALTHIKTSIHFDEWAKQMQRVYLEKGVVGVAYSILTIFRDVVFAIDNNCPHLYGFGERSAGKSKWAESITALFYKGRSAMNLNSGTDFAFFNYMQRFQNCPAHLNEFDEKVIKPEWFQSIKGIFDGEGRQRGVIGSRNRTEIMKIKSTLVLTGQFLCTMDDNSIVSRSLIEGFNERELTDADKLEYNKLKDWESEGLSHLVTEILQFRSEFASRYKDEFNETLSMWRRTITTEGQFNQRIMQNWCHTFTAYKIISKYMMLPMPVDAFEKYCYEKAIHWSAFIRSSDTLSEFWNTFSFLVDQGTIVEGWDYKIEESVSVKLRNKEKAEYVHHLNEPTKVIYIRMNNVHKHYQQAHRMRTGKEGMTMENLLHYFSSRKYYLGSNKQSLFKRFVWKTENITTKGFQGAADVTRPEQKRVEERSITSSFVFLYDQLNIDIERISGEEEQQNSESPLYVDEPPF